MIDAEELPLTWSVRRFDDVLAIRKGNLDPALEPDEKFELFSIPSFDLTGQPELKLGREIGSSKVVVQPDDCLFSKLNPRIPRTWVVPPASGRRQIASTEFWPLHSRFKPDEEGYLAPEFLKWLFRCADFLDAFRGEVSGGVQSRQRLQQDDIRNVEIPVPPLAEQRRLVARIEALTSRLEQARQARQAALAEVDTILAAEMNRLFSAVDAETKTIASLGDVCGGIQKTPDRAPAANPVRYLTVAHVRRNEILLDDPRYFEVTPDELKRRRLEAGDVLIIEGNGSTDQIGRAALFRGEIPDCVHQNHVIRVRPNRQLIEPAFLNAFLNSPAGQQEVQNRGRTSTGLLSLSVGRIRSMEVPVPKLAEQRRIVTRLDALSAKQTELRRLQTETEALLAAFTPALLAKAFRGEL